MLRLNTSHYFYHFLLWSFIIIIYPCCGPRLLEHLTPLFFAFGSFLFKSCFFFVFSFPFVRHLLPLHPPFMAITHFSASGEEHKSTLIPSIKTSPTAREWKTPLGCFSVHPAVDLQICSFAGSWLGCTRCTLRGQHTTAGSSFLHTRGWRTRPSDTRGSKNIRHTQLMALPESVRLNSDGRFVLENQRNLEI